MSVIDADQTFSGEFMENLGRTIQEGTLNRFSIRTEFGFKLVGILVSHHALYGFAPAERAAPVMLRVDLAPVDGSFDYPGGTHDPGEVPLDPFGTVTVYRKDDPGHVLFQSSGLSLSFDDLDRAKLNFARLVLDGADTIRLSDERDTLSGLRGDDTILGRAGSDRLFGNGGNDRIVSSSLAGERAWLDGGAGRDTVSGGAGDDVVKGGKGADILSGGGGKDRVLGGAGNDILRGGEGADLLTGGRGADNFVFGTTRLIPPTWDSGTGAEADTIADFTRGEDHLDLSILFGAGVDAVFRGTKAFTGTGQVRVEAEAGGLLVQVNIAGDLAPELEIHLAGLDDLARGDLML